MTPRLAGENRRAYIATGGALIDNRQIAKAALASTVKLFVNVGDEQFEGTGFFVNDGKQILTCWHVLFPDGKQPTKIVVSHNNNRYEANVLKRDQLHDLAMLGVNATEAALTLRSATDVEVGDDILFAGFPSGVRTCSVFKGMVSAKGDGLVRQYPFSTLQIDGTINLGNSGGPLFNKDGLVVGVCSAKYVPLFSDVDTFRKYLKAVPKIQGGVRIMGVDFGSFFNFSMQGFEKTAGVLVLLSVGLGYAVPSDYALALA